jgi:ppGpp synthetase/RelA/SpoT-type nucleotidyltranferase
MNQLSNSAINKIGEIVRQGKNADGYAEAVEVLNVWRESHGRLMDEYYDRCTGLLKRDEFKNILVAQRLKRLPTILDKLHRLPEMKLSRLQDVAGVRIVVKDIAQLEKVEKILLGWPNFERAKDYTKNPKPDGYRGKHFIYRRDNLRVEIQLRTQIQHVWSTSVETVDTLRGTKIKTGGNKTFWNEFFRLSSIALNIAESHPKAKDLSDICKTLDKLINKNHIDQKLEACEVAYHASKHPAITKDAYYLVLNLDFQKRACHIDDFKEAEYVKAVARYQELESRTNGKTNAVLVAVNDIKRLEDLYPNYFLDVNKFREVIMFMLAKSKEGY